ncbi:hypothetical protein K1W54_14105 [Micromonospora sp. CPCC 205371]|nr:hypothetical protein [Micromonospora sp. CPCC 205371]
MGVVTASGAPPRRYAGLRMLLLALVAFGVAGMHTTGHPTDTHCAGALSHGVSPMAENADRDDVRAAPSCGTPDGLHPFEVCLAILTSVGLAVLIAWAATALQRGHPEVTPATAILTALNRGPPPPGYGLRLANLSVLRT